MSGREILRRPRSDPQTSDVPVVCISACEPSAYGEPRFADAGLVKPLAEEPFIAAGSGALERKVGHNRNGAPMEERL